MRLRTGDWEVNDPEYWGPFNYPTIQPSNHLTYSFSIIFNIRMVALMAEAV